MFITVKKQSKKECISLLIEHALIIWDKIKTCLLYTSDAADE